MREMREVREMGEVREMRQSFLVVAKLHSCNFTKMLY